MAQHLTMEDRIKIELFLKTRVSVNKIAKALKKSCSTISREIKKHTVDSDKVHYHRVPNRCQKRSECKKSYLCNRHLSLCRKKSCSFCEFCNSSCPEFVEEFCSNLEQCPFVCNGCLKELKCTLAKKFYVSANAQKEYKTTLSQSRQGINLTQEECLYMDELISPLLLNGQSIHHICSNNKDDLIRSEKTIYRYVDGCLFKARNIDMPRTVRMRPRKTKPVQCKVDRSCFVNRTYSYYTAFLSKNPGIQVVEIDSVEGTKGGKVLLTMHFKGLCDFMLAFIRDANTSQSVIDVFDYLYEKLKPDLFKRLFGCCLADRGTEFTNPVALEQSPDGQKRTRIFYCDPQCAFQKPNVELNHEFIRRILPKGCNFNHLDQNDIDLMMAHINSYGREKLNDRSPAAALSSLFGEEVLNILHVRVIPANEIILSPRLLKQQ